MEQVPVYYADGSWRLVAGDPWGPNRSFTTVTEAAGEAPYAACLKVLEDHEDPDPVELVFNRRDCIIGRHDWQLLLASQATPSPAWNETEMELVLTASSSNAYLALHQIHYRNDGSAWSSSVQLRREDGRWLLGQLRDRVLPSAPLALQVVTDE